MIRLTAAAVILLSTTAFPALAQAQEAIRIGISVDAASLDPRTQRNITDMQAISLIYSGLVRFDANMRPQPDLATDWVEVDPQTIVFNLDPDATFHDGAPVTPEDVIFTIETMVADSTARLRSFFLPVERIEKTGDHQVTFHLTQPYAPLFAYLDLGIVPKHVVEAGGDLSTQPVGSGPYKFVSWERGSQIAFEANADFFGGEPALDNITYVLVPDSTSRAQALEAGDLDVVQTPLNPQDVERLGADERFEETVLPGVAITYLNFNSASPALTDPRVRKAIGMMVDQATILDQIYGGIDEPATSILMPLFDWAYDAEITQPAFDPEAALTLLTEAGYAPGSDGILAKDGEKLSITLSTNNEDSGRVQTVEYLQNLFMQFGVEVDTAIADYPSFIQTVYDGQYDISVLGWTVVPDMDRITYAQFTPGGSANWGKYENAEVTAFLEAGRASSDLAERGAAYQGAARILAEEMPYYVLAYVQSYIYRNENAPDVDFDARGFLQTITR